MTISPETGCSRITPFPALLPAAGWLLLFFLPAGAASQPWSSIFPSRPCGSDSSFYSVCFADADRAFAVGEDGAAFRSTDGGAHFLPMSPGTSTDLYKIRFPEPSVGYLCGDGGYFARTSDGGEYWDTLRPQGYEHSAFYAMEWLDTETGLMAGGASAVAHGQATIPEGFILRTTDRGTSWHPVFVDQVNFFWSLAIRRGPAGPVVWATAYGPLNGGRIYRSRDSGLSWEMTATQLPFLPHDIAFLRGTGMVVGGNPFDFSASARIALQTDTLQWTTLPDTITSKGFAWCIGSPSPDTSVSPPSTEEEFRIGFQSGALARTSGIFAGDSYQLRRLVEEANPGTNCPIYDIAMRRSISGNGRRSMRKLCCGSGHSLYSLIQEENIDAMRESMQPTRSISIASLFPQPAARLMTVRVRTRPGEPVRYSLLNLLGESIRQGIADACPGENVEIRIDTSQLRDGAYLLLLQNGREYARQIFLVRH